MIIEIPLGYKKLEEYINKALTEKTTINSLILNDIVNKLRSMEYSDYVIGRMIFEEALDHQVDIWVNKIRRLFKKGKVPTKLIFKISIYPHRE